MNADLINDFDISGLDPRLTAVRCKTQEEADLFLEYLCARGNFTKESGSALSRYWRDYCSSTCYRLFGVGYCDDSFYLRHEWTVVDFCDIYHPQTNDPLDIAFGFDELFS